MHILTNGEYKLFCSIAQVSQKSLKKTLTKFLREKYETVIATEDYVYAVGDIPIALCAHMDTVFSKPPKEIYYDREKGVIWSPTGLGADDRAGVYSILRILKDGFMPSVLFLTDEEKGALGAEQLVKDYPEPLSDLKFIIELDRCGTNDCVFYDCANEEFVDYIEDFGFVESFGTFSDISEICPAWKVAGVNLSIGYESEHSTSEILKVSPMLDTIKKVKHILSQMDWPAFEYVYSINYLKYFNNYIWDYTDDELYADRYWEQGDYHSCSHCGIPLRSYELIPARNKFGGIDYYCPDCCGDRVEWCYGCGESFEKGILNKRGLCPDCAELDKYTRKERKK